MMGSRETDVEVGGSIGILNAEETVSESRRVFVAREKSAQKKIDRRCAVREWVAWKTFKNVLFFICLTFLIIQSLEFFRIYYTYPTTIATEITVAKDFRLPAITFCFRNTISYKDYCSYESHRCERPSNVEKFCEKHPYHCYEDTSNLTIPKKDSSTRRNTQYYLFEDKYNDDEILFQLYNYTSKKRTFVRDVENYGQHLKCYSENLHLYQSNSIPKIQEINYNTEMADQIFWKRLLPENIEPFYPPDTPQIFVAIHSPHVPLNPVVDLHPVMPERGYIIYVQLEKEEHLLPPPYQTNCKDNGPTKDAKEFNSPNSFQMCMEMCRSEYYEATIFCKSGMSMISSVPTDCKRYLEIPHLSDEQLVELEDKRFTCFQNCKQGCLKLQYKYIVKELKTEGKGFYSDVQVRILSPEVTVLQHVPLYGSGEIFSYVGGLLGCWLGISVFSFTDIIEKFIREVARWKKRFIMEKKQKPPTSEIHEEL